MYSFSWRVTLILQLSNSQNITYGCWGVSWFFFYFFKGTSNFGVDCCSTHSAIVHYAIVYFCIWNKLCNCWIKTYNGIFCFLDHNDTWGYQCTVVCVYVFGGGVWSEVWMESMELKKVGRLFLWLSVVGARNSALSLLLSTKKTSCSHSFTKWNVIFFFMLWRYIVLIML